MELPGVLQSMAEGSITLAGFAAVFRAFGGDDDPDGYSRVRLHIVIEGGLVVAMLCYLPAWLSSASAPEAVVWRVTSAIGATWSFFRIVLTGIPIARTARPLPALFPLAYPVGVLGFLVLLVTAAGVLPLSPYSGHLLGTILLLANVGLVFLAQVRAESKSDAPTA